MLTYFVVCIGITGIFCIVVAYLYLAATNRPQELPETADHNSHGESDLS